MKITMSIAALQEQILGLIARRVEAHFVERPGGFFVRHAEQISNEERLAGLNRSHA